MEETIRHAEARDTWLLLGSCFNRKEGHSITHLFMSVDNLRVKGLSGTFLKAAPLPQLPSRVEKVKFRETAVANRGLLIELFAEHAKSLTWSQSASKTD